MSNDPLIEGEIVFEETGSSFSGATAYVRLEDASRADAASRVIVEQVIQNISHRAGDRQTIKICLYGQPPDQQTSYILSVHVDVDRDGQISKGDYINVQSYPVLTFGYPNHVLICVRQVD